MASLSSTWLQKWQQCLQNYHACVRKMDSDSPRVEHKIALVIHMKLNKMQLKRVEIWKELSPTPDAKIFCAGKKVHYVVIIKPSICQETLNSRCNLHRTGFTVFLFKKSRKKISKPFSRATLSSKTFKLSPSSKILSFDW